MNNDDVNRAKIINNLMVYHQATPEKIILLSKHLNAIPIPNLEWAVGELIKTCQYLPSVKEIIEKSNEYKPPDEALRLLLSLELKFYQMEELDESQWTGLVKVAQNAGREEFAAYVTRRFERFRDVLMGITTGAAWTPATIREANEKEKY